MEFVRGRLDRTQDAEASWNAATCKTEETGNIKLERILKKYAIR